MLDGGIWCAYCPPEVLLGPGAAQRSCARPRLLQCGMGMGTLCGDLAGGPEVPGVRCRGGKAALTRPVQRLRDRKRGQSPGSGVSACSHSDLLPSFPPSSRALCDLTSLLPSGSRCSSLAGAVKVAGRACRRTVTCGYFLAVTFIAVVRSLEEERAGLGPLRMDVTDLPL